MQKRSKTLLLLQLLLVSVASINVAAGATISYNSAAAYNAAVAGLQSYTVDFTNIAVDDQNMSGYTEDGATFSGTNNYLYGRSSLGGFIYGSQNPGSIRVDLPVGTIGVAFDMGQFYGVGHLTDFILSTGEVFTMPTLSGFIGFTNLDCIPFLDIRVQTGDPMGVYNLSSDFPIIFNAYFDVDPTKSATSGDVPEPGTFALAGLSLVALGWRARRSAWHRVRFALHYKSLVVVRP